MYYHQYTKRQETIMKLWEIVLDHNESYEKTEFLLFWDEDSDGALNQFAYEMIGEDFHDKGLLSEFWEAYEILYAREIDTTPPKVAGRAGAPARTFDLTTGLQATFDSRTGKLLALEWGNGGLTSDAECNVYDNQLDEWRHTESETEMSAISDFHDLAAAKLKEWSRDL